MYQLDEIIGAANYWLDTRGTAHTARSHVEWACKYLQCPQPPPNDDAGFSPIRRRMLEKGWVRVTIPGYRISVDYFQINNAQLDWLKEQADSRQVPVVDNEENVIYTPGQNESLARCIVSTLLGEYPGIAR